jgi:ABC-type oligopeptide transport system substrate-binding subunit
MMGVIKGADDVMKGRTKELSGVKVLDDYTLQVTLTNPAGYFLSLTTRWHYWAVDKETVDKHGKGWAKAGKLVGTGAYKLEEWVEGNRLTLVANANYFGGKPAVERIEIPIIPDVATSMLRFEAGELDAVSDLIPADIRRFSMDPKLKAQLQITPVLRVTWLGINFKKEPFAKNKALREALAYGIDREKLVNVVFQGIHVPAYSFLPPGMPCYSPDLKPYSFDLKKAQDKLAEAGFPKGKGLEKYEITLSVDEPRDRVAAFEFLQAQLLENLGIKAKLEIIPGKTYSSKLLGHELQLFRAGMGADYPDPQEFLEYHAVCNYKTNYGEYCDPAVDKLILAANKEVDMAKRCLGYREAEQLFLKDAAIIPLFYNAQTLVVKPYIKGFQYTPIYVVPFNQISILDR